MNLDKNIITTIIVIKTKSKLIKLHNSNNNMLKICFAYPFSEELTKNALSAIILAFAIHRTEAV